VFIYSSTCFGRFPAHHQELSNCSSSLWFYLGIVVIVVLCSWSGRPARTRTLTFTYVYGCRSLRWLSHCNGIVLLHSMWPHESTYCVIIQTQRTQISGRNSNGTKHSGGHPEDDREKIPKHVGVLYLQTRF
jgi:hypothetical protein